MARYFEDQLARLEFDERAELVRITPIRASSRDPKYAEATLDALADGRGIIHSGVLWNPETRTYGVPDFLIRSDVFERLFPRSSGPVRRLRPQQSGGRSVGLALCRRGRQVHDALPLVKRGNKPAGSSERLTSRFRHTRRSSSSTTRPLVGCRGRRHAWLSCWVAGEGGSSATEKLGPVLMTKERREPHEGRREVGPRPAVERRDLAAAAGSRVVRSFGLQAPAIGRGRGPSRQITDELGDPIRLWQVPHRGTRRRPSETAYTS